MKTGASGRSSAGYHRRHTTGPSATGDVTGLLLAWRGGDQEALDHLVPLVYAELRRLAHGYMRGERPGHSLQTTALIHEAYLRLVDAPQMRWQNRAHFFAVSAQVMRRVLVDVARAERSLKRGGDCEHVAFDEALVLSQDQQSGSRRPGRGIDRARRDGSEEEPGRRAALLRRTDG